MQNFIRVKNVREKKKKSLEVGSIHGPLWSKSDALPLHQLRLLINCLRIILVIQISEFLMKTKQKKNKDYSRNVNEKLKSKRKCKKQEKMLK